MFGPFINNRLTELAFLLIWTCMFQAKCEAFLAGNFGALKHHIALNELSKETWMRLTYVANYTGSLSKTAVLHQWITQGFPYPTKAS